MQFQWWDKMVILNNSLNFASCLKTKFELKSILFLLAYIKASCKNLQTNNDLSAETSFLYSLETS